MRRRVTLALLATSGVAAADGDPRDVFGLKPKLAEPVDCGDAKTFGCATATDPFDPVSPYALRTWLPTTYTMLLPVADARHDDVAAFATGATRDDVGVAFAGATGLENTWTIEGAPVENFSNGNVETRIPLAFTRGLMVTAGGFAARDRAALGGSIDVELVRGTAKHEVTAYAWTGLNADARTRPIAGGAFQLRRLTISSGPEASFAVVATGPLKKDVLGGTTWYAAGVAGFLSLFDIDWRAARLVDSDADGIPDGLPGTTDIGNNGKVDLEPISATGERIGTYNIPFLARAGWDRGPHALTLTLLASTARDSSFLANATQLAAGTDRTTQIADGIASWKGTWADTRARVIFAWHRSVRHQTAHDPAAAAHPELLTAYIPTSIAEDPTVAAKCNDEDFANDPYPAIPNCPVPFGFFASAGAGELTDVVGDRPTVTADIARRHGDHVFRVGGTFEDARQDVKSTFTGGEVLRSLFIGHLERTRFFGASGCGNLPTDSCDYIGQSELIYRTRYSAAYVEDTFTPVRGLRVDGGVRWELMWVGPRLHFSKEFAPRLGVAWDLRADGSTRVWASLGRSHAMLPAGMGPSVIARDLRVRDIVFNDVADRRIDRGATFTIADDVQPITQDEAATGLEIGVVKALRAGVWVQQRSLRRGLETVQQDVLGNVVLDNPGRGGTFPGIDARRESTTIAAEVMIAPSPTLSVRATYLWGRTVGNWTGPFDPRQGTTLYTGIDWDLDATNLYGHLPSDAGHRVVVEGERRGRIGPVELAFATRLTVSSGRPLSVLGDSDFGIVQLVPRGSNGRTPTLSQATIRVAALWRHTTFTLDAFNVFDRQTTTSVGEVYAGDQVHPIVGGSFEDLVFAKTESCGDLACNAAPAARRSGFGLPTSFQSPLSVVLGARRSF